MATLPRPDDRRGHRRVADHEGERQVDDAQARPPPATPASASAASSLRWLPGSDMSYNVESRRQQSQGTFSKVLWVDAPAASEYEPFPFGFGEQLQPIRKMKAFSAYRVEV